MPTVVGDLRAQAFGEIWTNSAVFAELRRRELGGKCGRCEYRRICGGCRARALALTGDYLAADPSCAYEPTGERPVIERARDVTYGAAATPSLTWTAPAEERLRRVPSFVRAVVVRRVEEFARARGLSTVTPELLGEIRAALPVDFSKRKPFFLRDD
jgi:hypothetical protein